MDPIDGECGTTLGWNWAALETGRARGAEETWRNQAHAAHLAAKIATGVWGEGEGEER